ncbi:metallophosphoesterase [Methylopila sp. 73B]|uniref:metallophosphoesterase n=1 Tax=Methylopila sp. 73B TaxID=1120792 RepID=UPI0003746EE2|nr:metallophosphoesterase [Methylopila sp. 73B]
MVAVTVLRHEWRPAIRPAPPGVAIAAVGDVHGQIDLFAALRDVLEEEIASAPERIFVSVGDLVDRGPGSLAALRLARAAPQGATAITLRGNHEDVLLDVLAEPRPEVVAHWLEFGGGEVADEAGVRVGESGWTDALKEAIGPDLLEWLDARPTLWRIGDLVFVHAGLDPQTSLAAQTDRTLMWIRRPWLESAGPYAENVAVIHGHTPQRGVDLDHPHRINLDTGAYRSGLLSGLVILGDRMRLVQAAR